jgi:hypothetical protein
VVDLNKKCTPRQHEERIVVHEAHVIEARWGSDERHKAHSGLRNDRWENPEEAEAVIEARLGSDEQHKAHSELMKAGKAVVMNKIRREKQAHRKEAASEASRKM